MLVWVCDLIGDRDATPIVVAFGVNGAIFSHPWEFGPRKAKNYCLPTVAAAESVIRGMVNHVVAPADLTTFTDDLAAYCPAAKYGIAFGETECEPGLRCPGLLQCPSSRYVNSSWGVQTTKSCMVER